MDTAAKKRELMDWLQNMDDDAKLSKVWAFKTILDKEVVAHDVKGYPVTKDEYIYMVREADERISSGQFTTFEELEKEVKNW